MKANVAERATETEGSFNWDPFENGLGEEYVLSIYLPGCGENDLHIEVDAKRVDVHCDRPWRYARVFPLPNDSAFSEIRSSYSEGTLTLKIPKGEHHVNLR